MINKSKLSAADRAFFETVARAAFANPFGKIRDDLDLRIAEASAGMSSEEVLQGVLHSVAQRLDAVGRDALAAETGNRREILHTVILFHLFHRFADDFDNLIRSQSATDTPVKVRFAHEALFTITSFGLMDEDAERYFAFFFQLRRAFHFIRSGLVGTSASMKDLRRHLWDCVFTHDIRWFDRRFWDRMEDFSILLLGETGTGKGAAAAAIGRSGFIPFDPRRNAFSESFTRNFLAINLSQFSEGVLESELFGHRKGAFTGAVESHEGIFSRCAPHGVIFLDEIGDVSIPVQIKLLQVLQDRVFHPVGSHDAKRFSGRVIAATNRPLDTLREEGLFRDDLYYRLCSHVITLPSLRERLREEPGELNRLIGSILGRVAGETTERERDLVEKVLVKDVGKTYEWPGNVRELEQAVKRIILTGHYQPVRRKTGTEGEKRDYLQGITEGILDAESIVKGYCRQLYARFGTYEEVARRTKLDRRTVKKYVQDQHS